MNYNNYSYSIDKQILFDVNNSDNLTNSSNDYDLSESEIKLQLHGITLLNKKFLELINKLNFIKKNITNKKIINSTINNIIDLTNHIDNSIEQIDEQVINMGIINKNHSIEIEFTEK